MLYSRPWEAVQTEVGTMAVASMPMYDMPEVRKALDSLWAGLARYFKREGIPEVPGMTMSCAT